MTITEAFNEAKILQSKSPNMVAKVVKKNYSGYEVQREPIELSIIKSSLAMIHQNTNNFMANVGAKYER